MLSLTRLPVAFAAAALFFQVAAEARDWARFRGPNGAGVSQDPAPPIEWSAEKNVAWSLDLPGAGSSSPIVVGDKVLVTCFTGYGLDRETPGEQKNLSRCLLAYDRRSGDLLWRVDEPAKLPEDEFAGMFAEHGYASHTPVSDGRRVYVYYGKSGAIAYDLAGKEQWRFDCGDGFGAKGWGSASSPVLAGDLLIVSATAESESLVALDKTTGREVWRKTEEGWDGVWSTPVLVTVGGKEELVVAAPFKVFGLDPATGEELWSCTGIDNDTISSSPVLGDDGVVYVVSGRGGSLAVRCGGRGEVSNSHVVWRAPLQGSIASPIFYEGRLYGIGRGGIECVDAATAERVYQARFEGGDQAGAAGPDGERRGRRGGGFNFRSMAYSSPVVAGDLMVHFGRDGVAHVVRLAKEYQQVARNTLSDGGDFSATPALSEGDLFVRSSKRLYCLREGGGAVAQR